MTTRYEILMNTVRAIQIRDRDTGYIFGLFPDKGEDGGFAGNTIRIGVTARDLDEYGRAGSLNISPQLQYVDVGAGLGGFIPHVVSKLSPKSPRPIVIDPADYRVMCDLLTFAIGQINNPRLRARTSQLLSRGNLILDSNKVRLVNCPVEECFGLFPNLEGIADVVVDNHGPYVTSHGNAYGTALWAERRLLKPTGILIKDAPVDA